MCLIVDANVVSDVLCASPDPDFAPVHGVLFAPRPKTRLTLVYGGRLSREYTKHRACLKFLAQLDRSGRARTVADDLVDSEEKKLTDAGACVSDDPHIVALAQISGARLLCSHDTDLHADFTSPKLVSSPRGKVYQNSAHTPLIRKTAQDCAKCR